MKIEYINPFVDSVSTILSEMLKADARRGEMYVKTTTTPIPGVAAIVGLSGDLTGRVLYGMSEQTALAISSDMNMADMSLLDDEVKASLKELAGLISGQAITFLKELGISAASGLPVIIAGKNLEVFDPGIEALICSVETRQGTIQINVAVEEMSPGT